MRYKLIMNESSLDPLISALKERRLPPCPVEVERNVLRRVRSSSQDVLTTLILFQTPAIRAAVLATAAAVAILLGSTTAFWTTTMEYKHARERKQAIHALDFDVFRDPRLQASARRMP